ncbi:armadillo-type protein [Lipomyces japonicus]|uniref:armadillo-type protein n=1 Tax=Lipomyces japonicus TaxID=56871 RepID=UPI0034CF5591
MAYNVNSSQAVLPLLEKLALQDSDLRFMALSDLHGILANNSVTLAADSAVVSKITDNVLRSLADNNAEVQNLAVKCLIPLSARLNDSQIGSVINTLAVSVSSPTEDLSATALRTLITHTPATASTGKLFVSRLLHTLLPSLRSSAESLEVLVDLINRFGTEFSSEQILDTQNALVGVLETGKGIVRKRAVAGLGALSVHLTPERWQSLTSYLHDSFDLASPSSPDRFRVLVSVPTALCRSAPANFSPYVFLLAPQVLRAITVVEDDEVREHGLTALDTFLSLCPNEMNNFVGDIIATGVKFVKYDPNYAEFDSDNEDSDNDNDDDDSKVIDLDDNEEEDEDEGNQFDDIDLDEGFTDDEDVSWKLRRGSAKLLTTLIDTRPDLISNLYSSLASLLVSRFKEHEESVRVEVLNAFAHLVKQITVDSSSSSYPKKKGKRRMSDDSMVLESDPRALLPDISGRIFKILAFHLQKTPGVLTKQASIVVATELVAVLQTLPDELARFIPALQSCVLIGTLRSFAINFVTSLTAHHSLAQISVHLLTLISIITTTANDKFFKISSEALAAATDIIDVITSDPTINASQYVSTIRQVVISKAAAPDIEVREKAITAIGQLLIKARSSLSEDEFASDLEICLDRLKNETTRLISIKTIDTIASSQRKLPREWVNHVAVELTGLLRKSNKSLRASAFGALKSITDDQAAVDPETAAGIIAVLRNGITEEDSTLLGLSLSVLANVAGAVNTSPDLVETVTRVAPLATSTATITPFLALVVQVAKSNQSLLLYDSLSQPNVISTSAGPRALAAVILNGSLSGEKIPILQSQAAANDANIARGALQVLGELAKLSPEWPSISVDFLLSKFSDPSDEIRITAAQTLGSIAAVHVDSYVPSIINKLVPESPDVYLLLIALKEVISFNSATTLAPFTEDLRIRLFSLDFSIDDDSAKKAVAAESIGRLALLDPARFLPDLQRRLSDGGDKTILISAVRFIFTIEAQRSDDQYSDLLRPIVTSFFNVLKSANLDERRLGLSAIASLVHNRPSLLSDQLADLVPLLVQDSRIDPSRVREVQMGPFKHKVDDGIDSRKAAYDALFSVVSVFGDSQLLVNTVDIIDRAIEGIDDDQDIKILSLVIVGRIAETSAHVTLLDYLDVLATKFTQILTQKLRETAIKQEIEKLNDSQRRVARTTQQIQAALGGLNLQAFEANVVAWTKYINEVFSKYRAGPETR